MLRRSTGPSFERYTLRCRETEDTSSLPAVESVFDAEAS
ncbi:hypothetical protein RA11412_0777 [Rothia aeria]|uniref:Uncharacterized protein n=1 Tax=Rothia aeria TaxID=172042 RepID=A0A2Z5QXM3_9MICC|nr:hypothetical protein RA11412_0777 [Rothia aeria]